MLIDASKLISTYKKNEHLISKLKKVQDEFHKQKKEKENKIYFEYDKKITALEKERDQIYDSLDKQLEKIDHKTEKKISRLYTPINDVKRIIYFLNQKELPLVFVVSKTTNYRHDYLELLEQYTDDHLKLALYIAKNDRPKNKYSLIIVGMCRFGKRDNYILKLPCDYGVSLHHSEIQWFDIVQIIKHFDSIQSAKKYHESHKIGIVLNSFLQEYHTVLQEYKEAISNYSISDFAEIIHQEKLP